MIKIFYRRDGGISVCQSETEFAAIGLDNRLSNFFLLKLNGVRDTINLDVCNVVLNVTNIYFVFVTIDFILIFFH